MSISDAEYDYAIKNRTCLCGSRLPKEAQRDADGIFLCYTCEKCEAEKMAQYRDDIREVSSRDYGENVDDDY